MLVVLPNPNKNDWDVAILSQPQPHILQSYGWGMFKNSHSAWRSLFFKFRDRFFLGFEKKIFFLGNKKILYFPRITDIISEDLLQAIKEYAHRNNVFLVKIEPNISESSRAMVLQELGFFPSYQHPQFAKTLVVPVLKNEIELLRSFKQKTRYNINLAQKKGVYIKESKSLEDLSIFYNLYKQTGKRGNFPVRKQQYYISLWQDFIQNQQGSLLLAYHDQCVLGGVFLFHFGSYTYYQFGASSLAKKNFMANYLLQYEGMKRAQYLGSTHYDMVGLPDGKNVNDPFEGVARFKRGFNGEEIRFIGAYDYYPNPMWKTVWKSLKLLYVRLLFSIRKETLF